MATPLSNFSKEFITQSIFQLQENTPRIEKCLAQISEEEMQKKPNSSTNSIANLIMHLCGNITQYIHSSLANQPDIRNRDLEFSSVNKLSKKELLTKLENTVANAVSVLENISESELLRKRTVQGFEYSGIGIIIHVVEHFSYHTGQIATQTKLLANKDLGFYSDMDLNVKNE